MSIFKLTPKQENTYNDLKNTYKVLDKWDYRIDNQCNVSIIAYNYLGHCWHVWIMSRYGVLANRGKSALLPSSIKEL